MDPIKTMIRSALALAILATPISWTHATDDVFNAALTVWESDMITYGARHGAGEEAAAGKEFDSALVASYYDGAWVMFQISDYLKAKGDSRWTDFYRYADAYRIAYVDSYVIPNDGRVPGYWNFPHGAMEDFFRKGYAASKDAALKLAVNAAYAADYTPFEWIQHMGLSREVAYAIHSFICAKALGLDRPRRAAYVDIAYGHIDQWLARFDQLPNAGTDQFSPFMMGLTMHALISDWKETKDPRLVPKLTLLCDALMRHAWVAKDRAHCYDMAQGCVDGAPDLGNLIGPAYYFLWVQSGDVKYRDWGDEILAGAVAGAWLDGPKQFNQNYRWSFEGVRWRLQGPNGNPLVSITAPSEGSTLKGVVYVTANVSENVSRVELRVDGNLLETINSFPCIFKLDTTLLTDGAHKLNVRAWDADSRYGERQINVKVQNIIDIVGENLAGGHGSLHGKDTFLNLSEKNAQPSSDPWPEDCSTRVLDRKGREVASLNGALTAEVARDRRLSSGVYRVEVRCTQNGGKRISSRAVVVR